MENISLYDTVEEKEPEKREIDEEPEQSDKEFHQDTHPVDDAEVRMTFLCCECGSKMVCTEFKNTIKRFSYKYVCTNELCGKKPEFWWSWKNFVVG